jgi:hypothetical protein
VPRPSSPLGAKASTERPCLTHHPTTKTPARSTKPRANIPMQAQQAFTLTLRYTSIPRFTCQRSPARARSIDPAPPAAVLEARDPRAQRPRDTFAGLTATALRGSAAQVAPASRWPADRPTQRDFPAATLRENGGKRIRTDDPLLAKQVLYQLSYAPVVPIRRSRRTDAAAHPAGAPHGAAAGGLQHPTGDFSGTSGARKNGPGRT